MLCFILLPGICRMLHSISSTLRGDQVRLQHASIRRMHVYEYGISRYKVQGVMAYDIAQSGVLALRGVGG